MYSIWNLGCACTSGKGGELVERMELTYIGHVGEVLRGGGGKLTPACGDPGDVRKPPGQEPPGCRPEDPPPDGP